MPGRCPPRKVVIVEDPVDGIELKEINNEVRNQAQVNELFRIEGEYKNPNFKL